MNTVEWGGGVEGGRARCPRADRTCGNVLFPDISLQPHLARGAAAGPGRSCGKVEGCRDAGLHRRMWQTLVAVPPPGVLWPLITPQRPRTLPAPPAVGSQWEDVALDSQLLRATIKEERLLLYWFSPNWSCVAAGVTTAPVN